MPGLRAALTALTLSALASGCTDPDFFEDQPPPNSGGVELAEVPHLSAAEVRIYLSDSTLSHRDGERVWSVYVDETGDLRGVSESADGAAGVVRARGTWVVFEDGRVCREWQGVWDVRDSGCGFVRQEGELFLFTPADRPDAEPLVRRREPGNPRGL